MLQFQGRGTDPIMPLESGTNLLILLMDPLQPLLVTMEEFCWETQPVATTASQPFLSLLALVPSVL